MTYDSQVQSLVSIVNLPLSPIPLASFIPLSFLTCFILYIPPGSYSPFLHCIQPYCQLYHPISPKEPIKM